MIPSLEQAMPVQEAWMQAWQAKGGMVARLLAAGHRMLEAATSSAMPRSAPTCPPLLPECQQQQQQHKAPTALPGTVLEAVDRESLAAQVRDFLNRARPRLAAGQPAPTAALVLAVVPRRDADMLPEMAASLRRWGLLPGSMAFCADVSVAAAAAAAGFPCAIAFPLGLALPGTSARQRPESLLVPSAKFYLSSVVAAEAYKASLEGSVSLGGGGAWCLDADTFLLQDPSQLLPPNPLGEVGQKECSRRREKGAIEG